MFEELARYEIPSPSPITPMSTPAPPISHSSTYANHSISPENGFIYPPYAFVDGRWVYAVSYTGYGRYAGEAPPACFTTAWSNDGTKFAAASQDGVIRVWDVRSGEPLSCGRWETGQGRSQLDPGPSSSSGRRAEDLDQLGGAPWGVRTLKFAKNASGREVLVFTEVSCNVTAERNSRLRLPSAYFVCSRH